MIECIFTIDYEIYGDGRGSLGELIYEPTEKLISVFLQAGARFVTFVEAAELEVIKMNRTDPHLELIEQQIRILRGSGFEVGLHLHPQWYNAVWKNGEWILDESEYNLCTLTSERIDWI